MYSTANAPKYNYDNSGHFIRPHLQCCGLQEAAKQSRLCFSVSCYLTDMLYCEGRKGEKVKGTMLHEVTCRFPGLGRSSSSERLQAKLMYGCGMECYARSFCIEVVLDAGRFCTCVYIYILYASPYAFIFMNIQIHI